MLAVRFVDYRIFVNCSNHAAGLKVLRRRHVALIALLQLQGAATLKSARNT